MLLWITNPSAEQGRAEFPLSEMSEVPPQTSIEIDELHMDMDSTILMIYCPAT
jgi:hypothetical protein